MNWKKDGLDWGWASVIFVLALMMGYVAGRDSKTPDLEKAMAISSQWEGKYQTCKGSSEFREFVITQCLNSYNSKVGEKLQIRIEDFMKVKIEKSLEQ